VRLLRRRGCTARSGIRIGSPRVCAWDNQCESDRLLTNSKKRTRRTGDLRRAEAAKVALDLIGEFGPEGVTTTAIARRMGVAQTALFKHFPNKEAIWIAATDALGETISVRMRAIAAQPGPPLETVKEVLAGYAELAHEVPAIAAFLCHRPASDGAMRLRDRVAERFDRLRQNVSLLLAQAASAGDLREGVDTELVAQLCIAVVQAALLSGPQGRVPTAMAVRKQIEGLLAVVRT
jgi:AcrR family transcriptional regulator